MIKYGLYSPETVEPSWKQPSKIIRSWGRLKTAKGTFDSKRQSCAAFGTDFWHQLATFCTWNKCPLCPSPKTASDASSFYRNFLQHPSEWIYLSLFYLVISHRNYFISGMFYLFFFKVSKSIRTDGKGTPTQVYVLCSVTKREVISLLDSLIIIFIYFIFTVRY